jgi:hypothetical protein
VCVPADADRCCALHDRHSKALVPPHRYAETSEYQCHIGKTLDPASETLQIRAKLLAGGLSGIRPGYC